MATEVSFSVYGERGSIDILAFHASTGSLLVIEIKSVVPDMQSIWPASIARVAWPAISPANVAGG